MVGITCPSLVPGLEVAVGRLLAGLRGLVVLVVLHDHLGRLDADVNFDDTAIYVGDQKIVAFEDRDPANLDWASVGADIVVDCTGSETGLTTALELVRPCGTACQPATPGTTVTGTMSSANVLTLILGGGRGLRQRQNAPRPPCTCHGSAAGRPMPTPSFTNPSLTQMLPPLR